MERLRLRRSRTLAKLKSSLIPGKVYRRSDLAVLSSNVDRHLACLVAEGRLKKIAQGLYSAPKETAFGESPPEAHSLLKTFLKDDHFVVYGFSQFNSLGVGTTQLYNRLIVFNRKRVGEFTLGGRTYTFHRWRESPKKLSPEFLVVELLNRLDELTEDRSQILKNLKTKVQELNLRKLRHAAAHYGTLATQKKLEKLLSEPEAVAA